MRLRGLLCVAVVVAGCGSASSASLEEAADATAAETSQVEMSYRFRSPEAPEEEVKAQGVFDYPNERGMMVMTSGPVPFYGPGVEPKEFRLIGRTGYIRWDVKGKSYWVKQDPVETSGDPAEELIPGPGTPTKPTDVLSRVLLASDEHEELGKEDVRGVETTHYRARVDLKELVKQLPPDERGDREVPAARGGRFVPVELWIDDESRLRRITIIRGEGETGASQLTITVELYDYGVEVDVQPPPGDELISQEEFDKLVPDPLVVEEGEVPPDEDCARDLRKRPHDVVCPDTKENE